MFCIYTVDKGKHLASVVIDSATYLLIICLPDIDNKGMSLYTTSSGGAFHLACILQRVINVARLCNVNMYSRHFDVYVSHKPQETL